MEQLNELLLVAPWATPLITVLLGVAKSIFGDNGKKFIPAVSLMIGVLSSVFVNFGRGIGLNAFQIIVVGLLLGGASTGLYEFTKVFKK